MWKKLAQCSVVSSPLLVVRYCEQVLTISSYNILNSPVSQASRRWSILCLIASYLVMCWAHWMITFWKTMNLSAFQRSYQNPVSSAASEYMKHHPTLLISTS